MLKVVLSAGPQLITLDTCGIIGEIKGLCAVNDFRERR